MVYDSCGLSSPYLLLGHGYDTVFSTQTTGYAVNIWLCTECSARAA